MSNKLRSIMMTVGWYFLVILWFGIFFPLVYKFDKKEYVAGIVLFAGVLGLPILFWAIRFYLRQKNRWSSLGTVLFIGVLVLTIICLNIILFLMSKDRIPSPVFSIFNTNTSFVFGVVTLYGGQYWAAILIAIEGVIGGVRLIQKVL